jgi:hypothetical protein
MEFSKTKLPQNPLIAGAYAFSYAQMMGIVLKENIAEFNQHVAMEYQQEKMMLDMARRSQEISKEDYNTQKSEIENMYGQKIKLGPAILKRELEKIFITRRLGCAEVLADLADVAPESIAAALLLECARSLPDYRDLESKFGPSVSELVSEVLHVDAYPTERETRLPQLSDEAKKIYLSSMICSFDALQKQILQIKKDAPDQILGFPSGEEQRVFADASVLIPVDKRLAAKMVTSFNGAAEAAGSEFRMSQDAQGALLLVKEPKIKPPRPDQDKPSGPKPPENNGGFGDAVF